MFYIFVLDKYADPDDWVYSARGSTEAAIRAMLCYEEPPNSVPKSDYTQSSASRFSLPPCTGGGPSEDGTIYGLTHV